MLTEYVSDVAGRIISEKRDYEISRMTNSEEVVIVWTTIPTTMDRTLFARALVDGGLAACVNVFQPSESTYRWTGETTVDKEHAVMIKTTRNSVKSLERRILELHDYDVPEFLVINVVDGYGPYLDWVKRETRKAQF